MVTDPSNISEGYEPVLSPAEKAILHVEDMNDAALLSIVTIHKEPKLTITANLRAPIVINTKNMKARQVVLEHDDHPIRYEIRGLLKNRVPSESSAWMKVGYGG
jgi:flagellar assembly factor FliW